jgi:dTDP-3-amino-3,4,6-trideoxy-alpha-D-glucose transaminase
MSTPLLRADGVARTDGFAGARGPTRADGIAPAAGPAGAEQLAGAEPACAARVPFTRLDCADPALLEELLGAVREVAAQGAFTLGGHVEAFEREFAEYCESEFAVGVSSGTDALALALRALEIGPGDEVVVPANSFIASAEAVSAVGAVPVPVDVDPDSHLVTAEGVAGAIGPRVRAVIAVHLFGATVDLEPILALARGAKIHVVEDACQAHGARCGGRRVGTLGTAGCFSFYPAKNLGGWGDGGAVVTGSSALAERLRLLRSHGERPRYHHRVVGSTARLDALQAAVLRRKLTRLDRWNDERRRLGAVLRARLEGTPEVEVVGGPFAGGDHVYHLFVVRCERRDALREHLAERGISTGVHYPVPIHRTAAYAHLGLGPGSLPVSEGRAERICSLPIFPGMTDGEVERVLAAIESFTKDGAEGRR